MKKLNVVLGLWTQGHRRCRMEVTESSTELWQPLPCSCHLHYNSLSISNRNIRYYSGFSLMKWKLTLEGETPIKNWSEKFERKMLWALFKAQNLTASGLSVQIYYCHLGLHSSTFGPNDNVSNEWHVILLSRVWIPTSVTSKKSGNVYKSCQNDLNRKFIDFDTFTKIA